MGMPDWWTTRRLGLFVHATVATVPAWSPIGQYAEWYRSHMGDELDDVFLFPTPMVEVVAHHRDRWGHIERYDDFVPLLTFDRFDAEEWARLAHDAGAGYSIFVSKHHDGWAWWDAPGTDRRLTDVGPTRNVLAEFAAACERNDIVFGTYYSLLDWGDDRYPGDDYVADVLHPHVLDLVERYGSKVLWGDGHWGHDAAHWRTAELMKAAQAIDPELVVNDRWCATSDMLDPEGSPIVRTFEYDAPDTIVEGPWELCRGIGHSFGHNRTERAEHHMTGAEVVDLYTEVVAKGGNLLLDVGPTSDGTIPDLQSTPLRQAGEWIRRHDHVLGPSTPWETWGDRSSRYVRGHDGAVYAIDLDGDGRLGGIDATRHRVAEVRRVDALVDDSTGPETPLAFEPTADGVRIHDQDARSGSAHGSRPIRARVYRLLVDEVAAPVALFETETHDPIPLAPLLADARPGDIVQLGDGVYAGPATVPDGVALRGLGASRSTIRIEPALDGTPPALTVGARARVEHLAVTGPGKRSDWFPPVQVDLVGDRATMLGCTVSAIVRAGADDVVLRAVTARGVVADDADRLSISRCSLSGNRWDVGVLLRGGGGQMVESTDFADHLCSVRAQRTTGTEIRHNTISGRWWGVHLEHTEDAHVHGNHIRTTMRAVDLDGGTNALVDGNAVSGGDSGCIVQRGAASCTITGNHWEQCRVGLLAWEAGTVQHHDNVCVDLHEPDAAATIGP